MKLSYAEVRRRCLKPNMAEKPSYGKHVTHFFSTRIVWFLSDFSVHPDYFTTLSLVLGLLGGVCFWAPSSQAVFLGALLIEAYYVFDAVDGQWARLKKCQTKTGAFFDAIVTYLIQPFLYFSIGWGLYVQTSDHRMIFAGALAAFSILWITLLWHFEAAIFLYFIRRAETLKRKAPPVQPARAVVPKNLSPAKKLFSFCQRSLTFPFTMNCLSAIGVLSLLSAFFSFGFPHLLALQFYIVYLATMGCLLAFILTAHWILTKKIDADYTALFE